ncbi:proton-coupled folate transporter-like [Lingula anatina]|uniref:Proton-coupled folate transporter-like n=1 Tax=Lingula anatina TaxID=7574 RepID=A0A1S3JK98_LINAN|nr:proton-coupled folate transporter-like [Lingula anatina]|eukprot:XP_013410845.1 proton-coupled folate transporter-like [Lingula anatina]
MDDNEYDSLGATEKGPNEKVPLIQHGTSRYKPRCPITVEPVMFLYFLGTVATAPLATQYLHAKVADDLHFDPVQYHSNQSEDISICLLNASDPVVKMEQLVQEISSGWLQKFSLATMIPAIIVTTFYGSYSDKGGRKFCILLPCVGSFIKNVCNIIVVTFKLDIFWLVITCVIEGMFGYYATILIGGMSYIADITTEKQRAFRILVLEVMLWLGSAISQVIIGYWVKADPTFLGPTVFITVLYGVSALYTFFLITETVEKDPEARFFTLDNVKAMLLMYARAPNGEDPSRVWKIRTLCFTMLFGTMSLVATSTVDVLYELNFPFCWTSTKIGWYTAAVSVATQVAGLLTLPLFKRCKMPEPVIMMIGTMSALLWKGMVAFANHDWEMYVAGGLGVLGILLVPVLRAVMSEQVSAHEQGTLFASIASIDCACSLLGGVLFSTVYEYTVMYYRGAVYLTMVGMYTIALIAILYYFIRSSRERKQNMVKKSCFSVHNHDDMCVQVTAFPEPKET